MVINLGERSRFIAIGSLTCVYYHPPLANTATYLDCASSIVSSHSTRNNREGI